MVEAALLLEEHYQDFCDQVWYIHTDPQIRIRRLEESRGYTREKAEGIIASQATEEYFRADTDYVIENSNDLDRTYAQIREEDRETCGFVVLPAEAQRKLYLRRHPGDTSSDRCRDQRQADREGSE